MNGHLPKGILSASVIATRLLCSAQSQVYSQSIGNYGERHGLTNSNLPRTLTAAHRADEVRVASYSHGVGSVSSFREWYVSTNDLAKQPRWDGFSKEAPLSVREACAFALPHISEQIPVIKAWSVKSVRLRNPSPDQAGSYPDIWCYEIIFTPRAPELRKAFDDNDTTCPMQVVLLDKTVVPFRRAKPE